MCLVTVTRTLKHPRTQVEKAWKSFYNTREGGPVTLPFMGHPIAGGVLPRDTWIKAVQNSVSYGAMTPFGLPRDSYISGFHAFTQLSKRNVYCGLTPIPVYIYHARVYGTTGMAYAHPTVVSDWLYIPSDPDAPAPAAPTAKDKAANKWTNLS